MPECETPSCGFEALFSNYCSLCSMGKGPSDAEKARYKPRPQPITVTWMGSLKDAVTHHSYDRERNTAVNIAGGPSSSDGGLTTVDGLRVHHRTVPRANYSIWYVRTVSGISISVYGIGRHVGTTNKKYDVEWHTGKNVTVQL